MTIITTHVLDTARGRPAAGIAVSLARSTDKGWSDVAATVTGADGRTPNLVPDDAPRVVAVYRLRFGLGDYFGRQGTAPFYPYADVVFTAEADGHYHVPLLASPFGYTTYRGS